MGRLGRTGRRDPIDVGPPFILVFCPSAQGGIADYAHEQAEAMAQSGCGVVMLCPDDFLHCGQHYSQMRTLPATGKRLPMKWLRVAKLVKDLVTCQCRLSSCIRSLGVKSVLFASYVEYLAPLWAWRLRLWRRSGVRFGAVVHDPVRDFVLGPLWWHRWSVSEGYSFLDVAFVHQPIALDTGSRKVQVRTEVIPHGPYFFPSPSTSRIEFRNRLNVPEDAVLFLSFGHLRDGKNLDLILEAMRELQQAWLLVVGTEAGSGHSSSGDYQILAERYGVASRCLWRIGFASTQDTADVFHASDFALLTYRASFRSASGVLNLAVRYRRLMVVSAGDSNLATSIVRYSLGERVGPDSVSEIARGMKLVMANRPTAEWMKYERDNSWQKNASIVMMAFDELGSESGQSNRWSAPES